MYCDLFVISLIRSMTILCYTFYSLWGIVLSCVIDSSASEVVFSSLVVLQHDAMTTSNGDCALFMQLVEKRLGNYRLTQLIGTGAFADIYLSTHIYLNSHVAIKVPRGPFDAHALDSFLTESR